MIPQKLYADLEQSPSPTKLFLLIALQEAALEARYELSIHNQRSS